MGQSRSEDEISQASNGSLCLCWRDEWSQDCDGGEPSFWAEEEGVLVRFETDGVIGESSGTNVWVPVRCNTPCRNLINSRKRQFI